jgi:hypothetical protein
MKKIKQDTHIAGLTKSGIMAGGRQATIRKHQCDILISDNHIGTFRVEKNRHPLGNGLPCHGPITIKDILSLGRLMPRKKKKVFKNKIISEYGWLLRTK